MKILLQIMVMLNTIKETVRLIRENNPGCYVTRGMIEHAIKNGEIGYMKVGSRTIVSYEHVQEYLDNACKIDKKTKTTSKTE